GISGRASPSTLGGSRRLRPGTRPARRAHSACRPEDGRSGREVRDAIPRAWRLRAVLRSARRGTGADLRPWLGWEPSVVVAADPALSGALPVYCVRASRLRAVN